ncbi:MAG: hypothetical protein ABIO81_02280 [Ginsengibacter sp.]
MKTITTLRQVKEEKLQSAYGKILAPVNSISKEEEEIIALLEKRWHSIQSGKSKIYTSVIE